ncbi:MAG: RsmE family RNA methyltransferase [Acidimicrobiia bacterium]
MTLEFAAASTATAHVFVDELSETVEVTGDDGHHLARVRRVAAGATLTAADGSGAWRSYRVVAVSRSGLRLVACAGRLLEPELTPRLSVAFALTKRDKPELVVQKLTELGVDVILPVTTRRTVLRWDPARAEAAGDRLARVARGAAMQCRRARVPRIGAVAGLSELAGRSDLVVADRAGEQAGDLVAEGCTSWCLVVGPEGGLDAEELAMLDAAPRLAVGPYVLRAETAAIAGAAALAGCRSPRQ